MRTPSRTTRRLLLIVVLATTLFAILPFAADALSGSHYNCSYTANNGSRGYAWADTNETNTGCIYVKARVRYKDYSGCNYWSAWDTDPHSAYSTSSWGYDACYGNHKVESSDPISWKTFYS